MSGQAICVPLGPDLEMRLTEVKDGTDLALWRRLGPAGGYVRTSAGIRIPDTLIRVLIEALIRRNRQIRRKAEVSLWAPAILPSGDDAA